MSDGRLVYLFMLTSLMLWLLPAAIPLAQSSRTWLKRAAVAVLGLGFLFAFYQIAVWLITGQP